MKKYEITYSLIDEEFSYQHHKQVVYSDSEQGARDLFYLVRDDILILGVKEV